MIAASVSIIVAGLLAALAVANTARADANLRIAPSSRRSRSVVRPAIPEIGWRWWPGVGALVGWFVSGPVAAVVGFLAVRLGTTAWQRRRRCPADGRARRTPRRRRPIARRRDARRAVGPAGDRVRFEGGRAASGDRARSGSWTASASEAVSRMPWKRGPRTSGPTMPGSSSACSDCTGGAAATCRTSSTRLPMTLRERRSAAREVRALTAQARLSGAILGLLPIGFFAFLWMTSRGNIEGAFDSPIGIGAVVVGLTLEGVAFLWIRSAPGRHVNAASWLGPLVSAAAVLVATLGVSFAAERSVVDGLVAPAARPERSRRVPLSAASAQRLGAVGGFLLGIVLPRPGIYLTPLLALVGFRMPILLERRASRGRRRAMDAQLPQLLDLLAAASSAGLSAQLALRRAVVALGGPLAAELSEALDAVDLGARWRDELAAVADRLELPDLRRTVAALCPDGDARGVPRRLHRRARGFRSRRTPVAPSWSAPGPRR